MRVCYYYKSSAVKKYVLLNVEENKYNTIQYDRYRNGMQLCKI